MTVWSVINPNDAKLSFLKRQTCLFCLVWFSFLLPLTFPIMFYFPILVCVSKENCHCVQSMPQDYFLLLMTHTMKFLTWAWVRKNWQWKTFWLRILLLYDKIFNDIQLPLINWLFVMSNFSTNFCHSFFHFSLSIIECSELNFYYSSTFTVCTHFWTIQISHDCWIEKAETD